MRFFQVAATLGFLFPAGLPSKAQSSAPVRVLVHPGTELLQIIHLLSDTAQVAASTYNTEVVRYFAPYRRHPAVLAARHLSRGISCDYPVRLSWRASKSVGQLGGNKRLARFFMMMAKVPRKVI